MLLLFLSELCHVLFFPEQNTVYKLPVSLSNHHGDGGENVTAIKTNRRCFKIHRSYSIFQVLSVSKAEF